MDENGVLAAVFDPVNGALKISGSGSGSSNTSVLVAHGNTGSTETFDASAGGVHTATLDANSTFTFSGATNGTPAEMTLLLTQDATGSRVVTWPASVRWAGAVAPSLTATPASVSVLSFLSNDGGTSWYGFVSGDDMRVLTVPGAPTGVSGVAGDAQVIVSWTAPAANGGTAITGYVITPYIAGVAQSTTTVGVVLTATVTGLTNGTAYTFKVAAINAIGTGAQSTASGAVTPTAAFDPSSVTGMVHWLKADVLGLSDGAAVGTWTDSSTAAKDATQATAGKKPTYKTGILNGKAVVRFVAASSQELLTASVVNTATDNYTIIVVASTTSGAAEDCVYYNGASSTNGRGIFPSSGSGVGLGDVAVLQGGAAWQDSSVATPTAATIYVVQRNAGTTSLWLNGSTAVSIASPTAGSGVTPSGVTSVGSKNGAAYHGGDIAEGLVYNAVVSKANLNNIGGYLATKYGLTWTTIP